MSLQDPKITSPKINKSKYLSPVWLLPIIAAALGGWLMLQSLNNKGISITIHFDEAIGIKPGKTKIRYKGLEVGHVVKLTLDDQLEGVEVEADIKRKAASILRSETNFWLVSPKASLTGITGLDTLVSGNYIDVQPGEGSANTRFRALDSAPASLSGDGLSVRLVSEKLGSLTVGAPVYFKQITVGQVHDFKLSEDNKVLIDLVIDKKFANLVKKDSRFWNISGLHAELSGEGLKVHLDGIASLISGGIAFDSPIGDTLAKDNHKFVLFPNLDSSQRGVKISLTLPNKHGLKKHSKLLLNDLEIGEITQISLNDKTQATASLLLDPMIKPYLNSGSTIYLIKPKLALDGVKNLARVITGNYLGLSLGDPLEEYKAKEHFHVAEQQPLAFKGKKLTLKAAHLKDIKIGSPLLYLGYEVGEVLDIQINHKQSAIAVTLMIKSEHEKLLRGNSRFYIESPIKVNADFNGFSLETGGLDSFLHSRIILINEGNHSARLDQLYPSKQAALLSRKKTNGDKRGDKKITLYPVDQIKTINDGASIFYQGLEIGTVKSRRLKDNRLQYQLVIKGEYKHLVNKKSIFWYQSPLALDASLEGVKFETAPLSTLINGGIEMAMLDIETNSDPDFYPLYANYEEATTEKVAITLLLDDVRGLSQGTKIRYRGLTVGKIEQFWLSYNAEKVQAKAYFYKKYASLFTHQQSRFWIVEPTVSLTEIKNLDTLIKGAFIQAIPGTSNIKELKNKKDKQLRFNVAQQAPLIHSPGLLIKLAAQKKASIKVGSPIFFRQLEVGLITKSWLSKNSNKILFNANISAEYAHLIRSNSRFWNVSGFNIDVGITGGEVKAESLETIMTGGIAFSSPDGQGNKVKPGHQFELTGQADEDWLEWDPVINK